MREARQAFEKCQLAKNPQLTKSYMANLAQVYALPGERTQAIGELEPLSKMDTSISYGDLRYNPY